MLFYKCSGVFLYMFSCELHVMPPSITSCVPCVRLQSAHIIRIVEKYQGHQSHLIAACMEWGIYTVLCHGITPQWTDLTYIVANGNFWIWLISWWCRDEIMYEIMFHVARGCH